jgi:hypothetical protein
MPADGKLDASGSPCTSSEPEKLNTTPPLPSGAASEVVLLGGKPGERLEPVGVVGGAVLDRPVLHRGRHHIGHGRIQRLPAVDGAEQAAVDLLGEALPHHRPREDVTAEDRVDPLRRRTVGVEHTGRHGHTGGGGHGALRLAGWGCSPGKSGT